MKLQLIDKKAQSHMIRFLMVDDQQNTFNQIIKSMELQQHKVQGRLLDDLTSFEKLLNLQWDVVIFHHAYDFDVNQTIELIKKKNKNIPVILLSDISRESPEAILSYQAGVFDISTANHTDYLNIAICRAAIYTRLKRKEQQLSLEIDKLQQQTRTLVETTEYAVATFQEGVHVFVNEQYAKLFGNNNIDAFIGLPLLDILRPQDVSAFKQQFKRLSKGDFSQATFTIQSLNPELTQPSLSLQFSPTTFEGEPALQLVIILEVSEQPNVILNDNSSFTDTTQIWQKLQQVFVKNNTVALILYIVDELPTTLLSQNWDTSTQFFLQIQHQLQQLYPNILRISEHVFLNIQVLPDIQHIANILKQSLENSPKQISIDQKNYTVEQHLAYTILKQMPSVEQLPTLLNTTFIHKFDANTQVESQPPQTDATALSFGQSRATSQEASIEQTSSPIAYNDIEQDLLQHIENNTVQLAFQQLYDKEDIDTHIYEITSAIQHNGQTISLEHLTSLRDNSELTIKLDRWILVEASKALHQYLSKSPKARIVVNLHAASLQDNSLSTLLGKLVNLINSRYTKPLILQFQEEDLLLNLESANKFLKNIQELGVGFTVSDFGHSAFGIHILQQLDPIFVKLTRHFSQQLLNDEHIVELQEQLDKFRTQNQDVRFLIANLNDMTSFANAWNVDVRYLQGDYFQSKQSELIDNTG